MPTTENMLTEAEMATVLSPDVQRVGANSYGLSANSNWADASKQTFVASTGVPAVYPVSVVRPSRNVHSRRVIRV